MSKTPNSLKTRGILFYDGDCGLCTRSVRFFLWADRSERLRFAPLQGATARAQIPEKLREEHSLSTVVYIRDTEDPSTRHIRTDAVAWALIDIGGPWRWIGRALHALPKKLCDSVYDFIARHRMSVFPSGTCPLPDTSARARFLD